MPVSAPGQPARVGRPRGAAAPAGAGGAALPTSIDPTKTVAVNAAAFSPIVTPDGSGQIVEPAVLRVPGGWNGHKYWANITGYTNSNASFENPAIYYSDDGITFTPAEGVPFPLSAKPATGTNADPDIVLGPDGTMHTVWITAGFPTGFQKIWLSSSTDGVTWTDPVVLVTVSSGGTSVQSPVLLYDAPNTRWLMWAGDVPGGGLVKLRTCAGTTPAGTWSATTTCTLNGLPSGKAPWEWHILKYHDQLHMVTTMYTVATGGGADSLLHFGVSDDMGLTWTFNTDPLLSPSASGWDNGVMYRAAFMRDGGPDLYRLWYSAKSAAGVWRLGRTTIGLIP